MKIRKSKQILSAMLALTIALTSVGVTSTAAMAEGDIAINEANFPDAAFRNAVSIEADSNSDGYLSEDEIAATDELVVLGNSISDMTGIEYFTAVTYLDCGANKLTSLDLSKNTALEEVWCDNNAIISLDLSQNINLKYLYCNNNMLTSLDLSSNTALKVLNCANNRYTIDSTLETFSLSELSGFDASKASGWSGCTYNEADNTIGSFESDTVTYTYDCGNGRTAKFTLARLMPVNEEAFPDEAFRSYVAENIDSNNDGSLSGNEISAATEIDVSDMGISSLKGIEAFTSLEILYCDNNSLTSLDVSENTSLTELSCEGNLYTVSAPSADGSISLSAIPELDSAKASNWTGCTYNADTNTISDFTSNTVTYTYDCGNDFTAVFTLAVEGVQLNAPTVSQFLGGSLRIDTSTAEKASLRLGYVIDKNLPEGAEIVSWSWKYGFSEDQLNYTAEGEKFTEMSIGKVSNLVLTDIPAAYYKFSYYAQITVVYELDGVEYTAVDDTVFSRNIYNVATAVANDPTESESARAYAQSLLDAVDAV